MQLYQRWYPPGNDRAVGQIRAHLLARHCTGTTLRNYQRWYAYACASLSAGSKGRGVSGPVVLQDVGRSISIHETVARAHGINFGHPVRFAWCVSFFAVIRAGAASVPAPITQRNPTRTRVEKYCTRTKSRKGCCFKVSLKFLKINAVFRTWLTASSEFISPKISPR